MKQRVVTALALVPVVLAACVLASPYPLFLLCLVVTTVGFFEVRTLLRAPVALPLLTLAGVAFPFYASQTGSRDRAQLIAWAVGLFLVGVLFAWLASRRGRTTKAEVDLAGLWVAMPMSCIFLLHDQFAKEWLTWKTPVLLILLPVWAGDIAAMLVGQRIGGPRLWPSLSPGKTVAGSVANLVASCAVAVAIGVLIHMAPVLSLCCGLAAGLMGQCGDLFESYVKRAAGAKDSGSLLPGHGGLLDRIDSLLFAAPAISALIAFWR